MYSAINIDTKKALEAISESREYQINASALRVQKEQAYMEGVNKGLDIGIIQEILGHASPAVTSMYYAQSTTESPRSVRQRLSA